MADDLRARIAEVLNTTPAGFVQAEPDGVEQHARREWHRHDRHRYNATCALCRGEEDTLTDAVMKVVQPELDRLAGVERERDEARAACRSAAALLRSTADRLDSPQRPDPLLLNMAARDLDQTAGHEPVPQMTAEDVRGGFWPDMTGGRCSPCHLATVRGYDPEPDCPDCNPTSKET